MGPVRGREIGESFLRDVPDPFLISVIPSVVHAYAMARDTCKSNLSEEAALATMGHFRRAVLQDSLMHVASRHGLAASWRHNEMGSDLHLEIRSGVVVMTVATVAGPNELPSTAAYRETLARSPQLAFEGEGWGDTDPPVIENSYLYALITHGRMDGLYSPPGFVNIVFPDASCTKVLDSIPLFQRYHDHPDVLRLEALRQETALRKRQKRQDRTG